MRFDWDVEKNQVLVHERGVGFEEVLVALNADKLLDIIPHPNQKKYPRQRMYIVEIDGYAYVVPFVEDKEKIFLETIFPSRKATRQYLLKK